MFLRESMVLIALGFAVGLPVAYLVTRSVSALLFGITPGDPATTAITLFALSMTGLAASWIPARRAARIDPMQALRQD